MPQKLWKQLRDIQRKDNLKSDMITMNKFNLFSNIQNNIDLLQKTMHPHKYRFRDTIYEPGNESDSLYFLIEGQLEFSIYVDSNDEKTREAILDVIKVESSHLKFPLNHFMNYSLNKKIIVYTIDPYQYFGDLEVQENKVRYTTIQCISEEATVIQMNFNSLKRNLCYRDDKWLAQLDLHYQKTKEQIEKQVTKIIRTLVLADLEKDRLLNADLFQTQKQPFFDDSIDFEIKRQNPFLNTIYKKASAPKINNLDYCSNKQKYNSKSSQKYYGDLKGKYLVEYDKQQLDNLEQNYLDYLHPKLPNVQIYEESRKITKDLIFKDDNNQLNLLNSLSDPKGLGRYYNYEGASSLVANYLKGLPAHIISKMMKSKNFSSDKQKNTFSKPKNKVSNTFIVISLQSIPIAQIKKTMNEINSINQEQFIGRLKQDKSTIIQDSSLSLVIDRTTRSQSQQLNYDSSKKNYFVNDQLKLMEKKVKPTVANNFQWMLVASNKKLNIQSKKQSRQFLI